MFVCISKGNEVLKDIVAVELQGSVRLLIYRFRSLNVFTPHMVIHQFAFIFTEPFFSPYAVIKHLTLSSMFSYFYVLSICLAPQRINDSFSVEGDVGCSHNCLGDW